MATVGAADVFALASRIFCWYRNRITTFSFYDDDDNYYDDLIGY